VINGIPMAITPGSADQMPGMEDMPFPKAEEVSIVRN
jgi:hypothetical protein